MHQLQLAEQKTLNEKSSDDNSDGKDDSKAAQSHNSGSIDSTHRKFDLEEDSKVKGQAALTKLRAGVNR